MACNKNHSNLEAIMLSFPTDQGGVGCHKCTAYAYETRYNLNGALSIDNVLMNLE